MLSYTSVLFFLLFWLSEGKTRHHHKIWGAVVLETEPADVEVLEGNQAVLDCGVRNTSVSVRYRWLFSRELTRPVLRDEVECSNCQVESEQLITTLLIDNIQQNQTGFYQCEVSTEHNIVYSRTARIRVHYIRNTAPLERRQNKIRDHLEAFVLELDHCNSNKIESYPAPELVWEVSGSAPHSQNTWLNTEDFLIQDISGGNSQVRMSLTASSFVIYNLQSSQANATYTCYAKISSFGEDIKVPVVEWTIRGATEFNFDEATAAYNYMTNVMTDSNPTVVAGQQFGAQCVCAGYQHPHNLVRYVWSRSNGELLGEGPVLRFSNISLRDTGKYICKATIGDKTQSKLMWITVIEQEVPEEIIFSEAPQKIWYVVVASLGTSSEQTTEQEELAIAKRVGEGSVVIFRDENDEERRKRAAGVRDVEYDYEAFIRPICISSTGRSKWLRNGIEVDYPIKLPLLPLQYLTFQCLAIGEAGVRQRSIVAYVDRAHPVEMELKLMNETEHHVTVECTGAAYPPPKIDISVISTVTNEELGLLSQVLTTTTYSSSLLARIRKLTEVQVLCSVHNEYYTKQEELSLSFKHTIQPTTVLPKTEPPPETIEILEEENVLQEEDIEMEEAEMEETGSAARRASFRYILIGAISGAVLLVALIIAATCLTVRKYGTHRYQALKKERELMTRLEGTVTATSFHPFNTSPSPSHEMYDTPRSTVSSVNHVKKPPRGVISRDSSLKRNPTIHPADELDEYTDMRNFGSLKKKTGTQYSEVESPNKRGLNNGIYVLPSPPKLPTQYTAIRHSFEHEIGDPIYDNVELEEGEAEYDMPRTNRFYSAEGRHGKPINVRDSQYDKLEVDQDNNRAFPEYNNMLSEPGTPFSDI